MPIKKRFFILFWLLFIVGGLFLAVNGFERHLVYSILDKNVSWDWSFLAGLLIAASGVSQLIIWLK